MKKFIHNSIVLITLLLIISCQKDDTKETTVIEDSITSNSERLTAGNGKGTLVLEFSSSGAWSASVGSNASSWCKLNKSSGQAGKNSIEIAVDENETYDERNASITLVCGTAKKIITLTQKQQDAIVIDSKKVEVKEEGGKITLNIKANVNYTYEIDERCKNWIHKASANTKGLTTSPIYLQIDPNEETSQREGLIYVNSGDLHEEVTVYQTGATPKLVITKKEITVASSGETIQIEIASNTEYDYTLPEVDWISEPQTRALSTYTHYFAVAENTTYDQRSAEIQFRNKATGEVESVKVTQMQNDAIIVAQDVYNLNSEETILDFTVNTNVEFETKISDDWIQSYERSTTRALVEKSLSFHIDQNLQAADRSASISFEYGGIKQVVTINQAGRKDKMIISITHSEAEFAPIELEGNHLTGTATWGDGTQSDWSAGHTYDNSTQKTANFEVMGVEKIHIKALNSISSIVIYCNEEETNH